MIFVLFFFVSLIKVEFIANVSNDFAGCVQEILILVWYFETLKPKKMFKNNFPNALQKSLSPKARSPFLKCSKPNLTL